jgi:hypothetical protein
MRRTAIAFTNPNIKRELQYALSSLKYWQRELRFRKIAKAPRTDTIAQAQRRVTTAISRVCFWRGVLRNQHKRQERQLAHWKAFVVPTEFITKATP